MFSKANNKSQKTSLTAGAGHLSGVVNINSFFCPILEFLGCHDYQKNVFI